MLLIKKYNTDDLRDEYYKNYNLMFKSEILM